MTTHLARDVRSLLVLSLFLTVVCGLAYPLTMTGLAGVLFPHEAHGSLIERGGAVVGSELIGQEFTAPRYFHPRPSAAGEGYDAEASSGSNLGPTSATLIERVEADLAEIHAENGLAPGAPVPVDAVTASGSGLDPHISPAYARLQARRVAEARGVAVDDILALIDEHTENAGLLIGEPRVNVLMLNLALDARGG